MPEERMQEKEQMGIERIMLFFYFLCSVAATLIAIQSEWSIWMILSSDAAWLAGLIIHCTRMRTYTFRAYAMTCMMQLSAVIWSVSTGSLSMTVPVLSVFALALAFYGIPEVIYIPAGVSAFLAFYHLVIEQTVDLSTPERILQTVLEIGSVFFIEYVVYMLNKARMDGIEKQMQIIDSLKEAERSKNDFMANVSHEIRTPINTVCGMSEIILREDLAEQVRADVFSIQAAGRSLQSIVSDVLDFTEMQSGKLALAEEVYNITSTINDVINMSMARRNDKQIRLIVDCDADIPCGLMGDEQKIRRVIMNLINNAFKFTNEGGVTLSLGSRKTDYGINLIVRVKDTGIGMKKESLEKLFTSFNQVDTKRNRQKEGIGLGLAISQALVELMGGFITAESEYGRGTEIQFVVPQKVTDPTPIAYIRDRESLNVVLYLNVERYGRPEMGEAYIQMVFRMIEQLQVKCHVCRNLEELKRRAERETFTNVFISMGEYDEDREYFDVMSQTAKIAMILDRFEDSKLTNPKIRRLYKPFFILPIVMALNNEKIGQSIDSGYYHQGKFIAPEATILVVDDNLMNIRVVEGLLRPYKIKTSIATSGAEALEKIENMGYDVIFMDHMMPEMDGVETLQRIRQKQGNYFKKVPIVAVTANAVGGMREVFLEEGFQDFIAKPIEVSVMERVLRRILPQEKLRSVNEEEEKAIQPEVPSDVPRRTDLPADTFNEQVGLTYCGSLEDYIEVLQMIGRNGQDEQKKIRQYYENKDWKNYTTLVHAVKSTMRSVGVEKLSDMAKELEQAGKNSNEEYIVRHHDAMILEYTRVLEILHESAMLHPQPEKENITGLEELTETQMDKMALDFEDAAYAFDVKVMTEIAEHLSKCSYNGHGLAELMQPVMHKIQMADYLSASESVARLREKIEES